MNRTPLPRSSSAGPPQDVWLRSFRSGAKPRWLVGVGCCFAMLGALLLLTSGEPPTPTTEPVSAVEVRRTSNVLPAITKDATCADWAAWIPRRSDPAVVMQVVSKDYIPIQRNFIRLMERNSSFNRHNLYLMCMDDASKEFFEKQMGVRCVPMSALQLPTHEEIWKLRVRVLSCLVQVGRVDVIMSDADALWLNDPAQELFHGTSSRGDDNGRRMLSFAGIFGRSGDGERRTAEGGVWGGVRDSDVVASRGTWPFGLGEAWGSTMCMGFILFRSKNTAGMAAFLRIVEDLVLETEDDQISLNQAAQRLGIVWDAGGDMRYENSTGYGRGVMPAARIAAAAAADGDGAGNPGGGGRRALGDNNDGEFLPLTVTLLPHSTYTRVCEKTPVSAERTVVAHCYFPEKVAGVKTSWMERLNLWSVERDP